jgi:outer membrane protein TolC
VILYLSLNLDKKLYFQQQLPGLQFNYSLIQEDYFWNKYPDFSNINDNNKLGFQFYFPLFMRKERSKYQLVELKIKELNYERIQLKRDIQTAQSNTLNLLNGYKQQRVIQTSVVDNNTKMRDGEQRRFDNGESTVFLINTREMRMIESEIKLNELKAKAMKASAEYLYYRGEL